MICGLIANLNNFKDIRIIHQGQNTTISIATDATNPTNKYIFKTFNFNCTSGYHQKVFSEVFSDVSILTLSNSSIPANNYAITHNQSIFSFFNSTHYYESYSSLDFNSRLKPTFCSICISEVTLDKILRKQVQIANTWTLEDTLNCLFSVAFSMKRLHDNLLIHGNLCPSNIIVDKTKQCYISDFGLYKIKKLFYCLPLIDTHYSAPEIDQFHPTRSSDVFSYGVIMCRLLKEYLLPNNQQINNFNIIQLIMEGRTDITSSLPPFLSTIITQCLDKTPLKRCDFEAIINTFQAKSFTIKRISVSNCFRQFKQQFFIEKLANANDPLALNILGDLLSNPAKAFEINYKNQDYSQKKKSVEVNRTLNNRYIRYERQIDETMAAECYRKSASLGNSESQANYGVCLLNGCGVPTDLLNGISFIEKSAMQGCVKGLYALGFCHMKGVGFQNVDLNKAEKYFREAINASENSINNVSDYISCKAKYNLGIIMEKKKNDFEAAKCFKMAAYLALESRTNFCSPNSYVCPESLYHYGRYLKNGIGIPSDLAAAFYFFKTSHFQGHKGGSFEYARMILDRERDPTKNTFLNSTKYDKSEANLIIKMLCDANYKKAIDYINECKIELNMGNGSTKDKDKEKKDRDRDVDRNRDIDYHKEKKNHSDVDKIAPSSDSSKSRHKRNEKLQEKFERLLKDLIENQSYHLFDYEKEFIESKNGDIIYKLANLYDDYILKDFDKAHYYYKLAAELGNPEAQAIYGNLLLKGKIGPDFKRDFDGGLKMLQKSAMQECFNGMNNYSMVLLECDKNTDPKIIRCIRLLKDLADKGSPLAQLFYGKLLIKGPKNDINRDKEGFHKDTTEGVKFIKMAADAKQSKALYIYGSCMLKGTGMPKDEKKAMQIIEEAANYENDENAIAKCYRYYKDIDSKKAMTFLKKLADNGNKEHMLKYGLKLVKANSNEETVKLGERYIINSGKDFQDKYQLKHFVKQSNGKYVEYVQENSDEDAEISYTKKLKKLDEAFSDDYELKTDKSAKETSPNSTSVSKSTKVVNLKKEGGNDDEDDDDDLADLEPESSTKSFATASSTMTDIPPPEQTNRELSANEMKKLDIRAIKKFLQDRKENGLAPEGTNETELLNDAIKGDTYAMIFLGKLLIENPQTVEYGYLLINYSSERGNPEGIFLNAISLYKGNGVRPSKKKAADLLQKSAEVYHFPDAYFYYGEFNELGQGVQRSLKKAFEMYKEGANRGNVQCMLKVAEFYKKPETNCVKKNQKLMAKYLKMAVDKSNDLKANYKLGKYYLLTEQDAKKSYKYLKEAASRNIKACYLLYKLYSTTEYGSKCMTNLDANNYLVSACKGNYSKALQDYKVKFNQPFEAAFEPESAIKDYSDNEDDDDFEYVDKKQKKKKRREIDIFDQFEYNSYQNNFNENSYDTDKDFFQQVLGINPLANPTNEDIIKKGDDILQKANENFEKKKLEIEKNSNSKAKATAALTAARDELNGEKKKVEKCYMYAKNKGEPLGYFKYAQIINDPESKLSYFQYAKDYGIPEADDEIQSTLQEIGDNILEKYNLSKKDSNYKDMKMYQEQLKNTVAQKFINENAFVSAALLFRNADMMNEYAGCIEFAIENSDIMKGNQQYHLAKILESKDMSEILPSNDSDMSENSQKQKALSLYKRALENGYKEAERSYKRLSKELLSEIKSNSEDTKTLNELGLSFLEGINGAQTNYKSAASCFEKAAASGNVDAMVNFGKCLLDGKGVQQDEQKAFQYFKQASRSSPEFNRLFSNDKKSSYKVSSSEIESSTTSSDDDYSDNNINSINIENNKDKQTLAEGICYYAYCLLKGKEQDESEVFDNDSIMKIFKLAAQMGNIEAMMQYGTHCIEEPDGPTFLKFAAESGNPKAQYKYSIYLKDKDEGLSLQYLKLAAENRNYKPFFLTEKEKNKVKKWAGYYEPAVEAWGSILYENIDNETDAAVEYFKKLSDDKNVYGLSMYAKCIFDNYIEDSDIEKEEEVDDFGVKQNKYRKILKMAADLGDSESQCSYASEIMPDEDEIGCSREISKYLKMAADQGNIKAICLYATRLETGKGVDRNLKEAVKYCQLALSKDPNNDMAKMILEKCMQKLKEVS